MSSLATTLLAAAVAIGLSTPALAQSKMDAGSGPTAGAKPNTSSTAASNSNDSADENSAGVTPGPKSTGGSQPVTPITKKQ